MKGIIYFGGLMAFIVTSCTGVGELAGGDAADVEMTRLELSMSVDSVQSKSMIEGTSLSFGAEVGVYMTDDSGNGYYQGHDYRNIRYKYALGRLTTDKEVLLSSAPATVHAYYPYVSGGDISELTMNAEAQTDYLYAVPESGLDHQKPSATLVMKHAMSVVSFEIVKGDYTGPCEVSKVAVKGNSIYSSATYDGRTGQILSRSGKGAQVASDEGKFTAGAAATLRNIMVIPTESVGEAVIAVVVDGYERTVTIPDFNVLQGKRYLFSLTISDKDLIVSRLAVNLWDDEGFSHQISLIGDMDNISVSKDILQGGVVVLKAMPDVGLVNAEVEPVTVTGTADMTQESDIETGIRTITLSNVQSDVTVNFNGIYTYDLVTTYKAASGGTTRIMAEGALAGGSPAGTMLLRMRRGDDDMQKQEVAELGTGGMVTLKYSFRNHEIPYGIFDGVSSLVEVVISDVVKTLGSYSFSRTGLSSVVVPESVETYRDGIFQSCKSLKSVRLPDNLKVIPRQMFSNCSSLLTLSIPDSVESFGESAFEGNTGITSIIIPPKVTEIGGKCFYGCRSLRQIVCRPTKGPALTGNANLTFQTFVLDGICVIPASATSYSSMISNLESCGWFIERK